MFAYSMVPRFLNLQFPKLKNMLKNYIKIALAVLKRRKFFTFVSLFGISFTLTIIIVITAIFDHLFSAAYPDINRDRELYITSLKMTSQKKGNTYEGEMSPYFFDNYISKLKSANIKVAMHTEAKIAYTYANNKKLDLNIKYTNAQFWEVFQYAFIEGKPFTTQQIDNNEKVIIISDQTRADYFDGDKNAVGNYVEIDNNRYRVIGVVKRVSAAFKFQYGDAFLPYTESKSARLTSKNNDGPFIATILVDEKKNLSKVQQEYHQMISKVRLDGSTYDKMHSYAGSYLSTFTRSFADSDSSDSGVGQFYSIISLIIILFLLLPTLNLINLNISRITERFSEIGVRKAFGASSKVLAIQFVVENIILTLIGGLLGLALSFIVIQFFNNSNYINNLQLSINFTVLFFSLLACLMFGFLSGVYPAWRMSKLHVAVALKS